MSDKPATPTKHALEDEDEFEDFPVDSWPSTETLKAYKEGDSCLWEEDWDDVEVEDDFTKELKKELESNK
ncbi:AER253Wp [Eremothecium gossypii ATCC 10895]|uniref:Probable 26S proteasome complex subunit SEM1 n=1 Tax=Eremothecium gossypii (strain ATCC 10895 / CBS 109.51 / FGSC 9923 / NRRL Y-1056) TaxID=284811 RepID=SEM1_EREGS|nr:AER253Wp [Eremothecium gossypii ATCC 10895]P62499.1 RecName: Full=Probable 26S proteasome complex subunit SEM1 [Eremothecium gossypii ATCC 10895]AAS52934.1 AER253Wp [Eremothecium gossypii ATCC 10895]AEY97242.1 FAER253Wp [Eremothecium gossypii FDAG1]